MHVIVPIHAHGDRPGNNLIGLGFSFTGTVEGFRAPPQHMPAGPFNDLASIRDRGVKYPLFTVAIASLEADNHINARLPRVPFTPIFLSPLGAG